VSYAAQGYGNKGITLYDIRNELNSPYKDLRTPHRPPTSEEKFEMITKESLSSFREGNFMNSPPAIVQCISSNA